MDSKSKTIHIVGAGLAGTECALQLADRGYDVILFEMRQSGTMTPAHKTQDFAELVCSNSFGSFSDASATGIMKWEAEQLGSHILNSALESRVPAGQALSVDRQGFARALTEKVRRHPRIRVEPKIIQSLLEVPRPAVIATGPLTHEALARDLMTHFGDEFLYFYDAIAPIIDADTINTFTAWKGDRWGKGTDDYYNCPLDINQYKNFVAALLKARKVEPKEFEKTPYFESCLPIEVLAERGEQTLRFGPMSPKGLWDPHRLRRPYAVVQLRQDNKAGTAYNMVGFQTKMAYGEQKEIFRMIPGLERAEFLKLGSIHRNLYINSPKKLNGDLSSRRDDQLYFAGQITGVEGYFESACTGLLVALFLDQRLRGMEVSLPPRASALGSLLYAVTQEEKVNFQPTNINFGLLPPVEGYFPRHEKKSLQLSQARSALDAWRHTLGLAARATQIPKVNVKEMVSASP